MAIYLTNAKAIAALDAALSGAVELILYNGSVPADADTALSGQTAVATCVISAVGGAVDTTSGSAQATLTVDSDTNTTGGTATFFRIENSSNTVLLQGTVGTTSSFDLNLNDTVIPSSATLTISSFTITLPELGS